MEKYKQLTVLLDKDKLNTQDQKILSDIISDPEMKDYYVTYLSLKKALFKEKHIATDDLTSYVLYSYDLENVDDRILEDLPFIEQHLRECEECRNDFKTLNEEYLSLNEFIKGKLSAELKAGISKNFIKDIFFSRSHKYLRLSTLALVLVSIIYLSMLTASEMFVPANAKLARISERVDEYLTRGRISDEFQRGLIALENNNYSETIRYLKNDIKNNPSDKTIFYTHYILGLVYLEKAQSNTLGLFPAYNQDDVNKGINNLRQSLNKNQSGQYTNIQLDSYFFIGKGYLMLNNTSEAKKYFNLVITGKGSRAQEANKILKSIQE